MIKENTDYDYHPSYKRRTFSFLPKPPSSKKGFATPYGVKRFQDRFVMEGNHNLLFGTVNGSTIGMCFNNAITGRTTNTLVLCNNYKGWYNYTIPNLLAGHSSAVVVGDPKFMDNLSDILSNGFNIHFIDFNSSDTSGSKYNPFTKLHKPFPNPHYPYNYMKYLAGMVVQIFHTEDKNNPFNIEWTYKSILEYIFLYVGLSDKLTDKERNFQTVKAVITDLMEGDKKALGKYLVKSKEDNQAEDILESLIIESDNRLFRTVLNTMLIELQPLINWSFFEENNAASPMNITVEKLVNEKTYLFISQPLSETSEKLTAFFLSVLLKELYLYGESDWKYSNQALKNPVHFYLNNFLNYRFPYFLNYLATCRPYGIGFSIITELWQLKNAYPDNEHLTLCCNVDTHLFFSTGRDDADCEYIQSYINYPVNAATGKEIPVKKYGYGLEKYAFLHSKSALSAEELNELFQKDKAIVVVRDFYPVICDILNPDDYRNKTRSDNNV